MCLIVSRPADATFPIEQLEVAHFSNPHGVGFMWPGRTRIQVAKIANPITFQEVGDLYESVLKRSAGKPLAIHFRWATHGLKDEENTHPYKILDKKKSGMDLYMMHNGVIPRVSTAASNFSDTWHYAQSHLLPVLQEFPELIWAEWFQSEIGLAIGKGNKLLFMDNEGKQAFINYKQGHLAEDTGCWLSNSASVSGSRLHRNDKTPAHLKPKPTVSIKMLPLKRPVVQRSLIGAVTVDKLTATQGEIVLTIGRTGAFNVLWSITNDHLRGWDTVLKDDREKHFAYVKSHMDPLVDAKLVTLTVTPSAGKNHGGPVNGVLYYKLSKDGMEIFAQLRDGTLKTETTISEMCALIGKSPEKNGNSTSLAPAKEEEPKKIPNFPQTFTKKVKSNRRQRRTIRKRVALPPAPNITVYDSRTYDYNDDEYGFGHLGNYGYYSTPWYVSNRAYNRLVTEGEEFVMSEDVVTELTSADLTRLITKYPSKVANWIQHYVLQL